MHIFLDTSVIYTDPFWKRSYSRQLIESAKDGTLKIYFANVVILELRKNFVKEISKEISKIQSANSNLNKLNRMHENITIPDKEKFLAYFDSFYKNLFNNKNIIKLEANSDMFDDILDRAILYKKPFGEHKSEFKDAVIWTTYFNYAKENKLQNCHLLSANNRDFADSAGKLHPELLKDYDKFDLHHGIDVFYKSHKDVIEKPITEFKQWIEGLNIDKTYVNDILFENVTGEVYDEVKRMFADEDPSVYDDGEATNLLGGYIEVKEIDYYKCDEFEIDIIKDYAIISGILNLYVSLDLYGYNTFQDPGDEKFPYHGNIEKSAFVYFNFQLDKEEKPKNFEIIEVQ